MKKDILRFDVLFMLLFSVCACDHHPTAIDWSWGPVMPVAKSARATTAVGTLIVTVGGTLWETEEDETKTTSVDALDTQTMDVVQAAELSDFGRVRNGLISG